MSIFVNHRKELLAGDDLVAFDQDSPSLAKLYTEADAAAFPSRTELRAAFYAAADDLANGRSRPPAGQPEETRAHYVADFRNTGDQFLDVDNQQYRNTLRVVVGNDEVCPGGGGFDPLDKDLIARHLPERTKKAFFPSARSAAQEPVGAV